MMENLSPLSANIHTLFHELLVPTKGLDGVYHVLNGKVPKEIEKPLHCYGEISSKLHSEIMMLHQHPEEKIDLEIPSNAARQIRSLAAEWMKDIENLQALSSQIENMKIHLQDPLLDKILNEVLHNAIERFAKFVHFLARIQTDSEWFNVNKP